VLPAGETEWVFATLSCLDGTLLLAHRERKARSGADTEDSNAAMRIRVSDPVLIGDLLDHLLGNGCLAIQMSRNMVAVSFSDGLPYDAARLELDFHLADWLLRHADGSAVVID